MLAKLLYQNLSHWNSTLIDVKQSFLLKEHEQYTNGWRCFDSVTFLALFLSENCFNSLSISSIGVTPASTDVGDFLCSHINSGLEDVPVKMHQNHELRIKSNLKNALVSNKSKILLFGIF